MLLFDEKKECKPSAENERVWQKGNEWQEEDDDDEGDEEQETVETISDNRRRPIQSVFHIS